MNNGHSPDTACSISDVSRNPLTPLDFLKRCELVFPGKRAIVYHNREFTWKEFAARVYRLANGLKQQGIKKGDRVAIMSRNNDILPAASGGVSQ